MPRPRKKEFGVPEAMRWAVDFEYTIEDVPEECRDGLRTAAATYDPRAWLERIRAWQQAIEQGASPPPIDPTHAITCLMVDNVMSGLASPATRPSDRLKLLRWVQDHHAAAIAALAGVDPDQRDGECSDVYRSPRGQMLTPLELARLARLVDGPLPGHDDGGARSED